MEIVIYQRSDNFMIQNDLKRLRVAYGLTQQGMADKLHITQEELRQYEANEQELTASLFEKALKTVKELNVKNVIVMII